MRWSDVTEPSDHPASPMPGDPSARPDRHSGGMELTSRQVRRAVSDSTGLSEEELGFLIAAAAVATGVVIALRAFEIVTRLWAPSGGRS